MELASTMQRGHSEPKKRTAVHNAGDGLAHEISHLTNGIGKGFGNGSVKNGHGIGKGAGHTNGNGAHHGAGLSGFGNGHHGIGTRPGDVARELISALWERSVPLITDRLNGLDIACEAAVIGRLSPIMRRGAADTAHKLAGSLGMFGYPRGTDLAREIEQLLENDGAVDAGLLRELVLELRGTLPL
jgi:hypothetical protein